jgi:phage terminase large subunit-like protein
MSWREAAEKQLEKMPAANWAKREEAMQDLWVFAQLVNPGYIYGEIHKEVFRWLQDYELFAMDVENNNKLIMLPRGHLKSHMVATWAAWCITRQPEVTILYLSATAELAETQLYAVKNILTSKTYRRYWPEYVAPRWGDRAKWTERKIIIDHKDRAKEAIRDATIATAGLTTNTTGWHADVIIADDLVVPENAYTEDGRASVVKKASQFTSIRNAGGFTLACGTRYHPKDVYGIWYKQKFDIFDSDGNQIDRKKVWMVKEYAVEVDNIFIWPRTMREDGKAFGFDLNQLSRIKGEYEDRTQFYAQYYNDPNDAESAPISRDKFQYADRKHLEQIGGKWSYKGVPMNVYAAVDFAYSISDAADYTAIVVVGLDAEGYYYVLDMDRFKTNKIPVVFKHIVPMHAKWEFKKLRAEVTAGQEMIVEDLKDLIRLEGMRLSIDPHRPPPIQRKAERIAANLEHKYDNGSVYHFRGGYTDLLEEELVMARPAHDDLKDTLAAAVEKAVKPRGGMSRTYASKKVVRIHPRFGGVAR